MSAKSLLLVAVHTRLRLSAQHAQTAQTRVWTLGALSTLTLTLFRTVWIVTVATRHTHSRNNQTYRKSARAFVRRVCI